MSWFDVWCYCAAAFTLSEIVTTLVGQSFFASTVVPWWERHEEKELDRLASRFVGWVAEGGVCAVADLPGEEYKRDFIRRRALMTTEHYLQNRGVVLPSVVNFYRWVVTAPDYFPSAKEAANRFNFCDEHQLFDCPGSNHLPRSRN